MMPWIKSYGSRLRANTGSEEGGALIAVITFGMLASLVMLGLASRIVVEQREVANSLLQRRAYWAAMGINAYIMSRTAQVGWCVTACSGVNVGAAEIGFASEVKDLWTWQYPDVGANYTFAMTPSPSSYPSSQNGGFNGIGIRTTFAWTGTAPVVANMTTTRPVEIRFHAVGGSGSSGFGQANSGSGATMAISSLARPSS